MKYFMDETKGEMDFYSFHAYDFFKWNGNDFHGRIQSGLPLEGVLDLVQNYAVQTFGSEKEIVLSEHGGYVNAPMKPLSKTALSKPYPPIIYK